MQNVKHIDHLGLITVGKLLFTDSFLFSHSIASGRKFFLDLNTWLNYVLIQLLPHIMHQFIPSVKISPGNPRVLHLISACTI